MQYDSSPNRIFVRYAYNSREFDGIEEIHQMLGQESEEDVAPMVPKVEEFLGALKRLVYYY